MTGAPSYGRRRRDYAGATKGRTGNTRLDVGRIGPVFQNSLAHNRMLERGATMPQRKTLMAVIAALKAGGIEFCDGDVRLQTR